MFFNIFYILLFFGLIYYLFFKRKFEFQKEEKKFLNECFKLKCRSLEKDENILFKDNVIQKIENYSFIDVKIDSPKLKNFFNDDNKYFNIQIQTLNYLINKILHLQPSEFESNIFSLNLLIDFHHIYKVFNEIAMKNKGLIENETIYKNREFNKIYSQNHNSIFLFMLSLIEMLDNFVQEKNLEKIGMQKYKSGVSNLYSLIFDIHRTTLKDINGVRKFEIFFDFYNKNTSTNSKSLFFLKQLVHWIKDYKVK